MKSLNYLFTVSELRFLQYHVSTIKVFINKRVCDHVTYSTSISNSFQPCAHMYTITCGQPELLFIWEIPPFAGGATGSKFNMARQEEGLSIFKLSAYSTNRLLNKPYLWRRHSGRSKRIILVVGRLISIWINVFVYEMTFTSFGKFLKFTTKIHPYDVWC